ncbi:hypothetical protein [Chromatium okenii]|uniref:hypothetical protein n=1 Tax=Chromatium okenii TaxID=61644 RepID=UPI001F5BA970|nr:hypothetical protein [Chromatium okenii]
MNLPYLQQLAAQSGGILYLMLALLTLTLTVSVERAWALRSITRHGDRLIAALTTLRDHDHLHLTQLRDQQRRCIKPCWQPRWRWSQNRCWQIGWMR